MKKMVASLMVLMLLMASASWAASTASIYGSDSTMQGLTGKEVRRVVYTVTFDSNAASPSVVSLDDITRTNGLKLNTVSGWWLFEVNTQYGATASTADTDLYLYRYTANSRIDVLGGNGVNQIDAVTDNTFHPVTTSKPLVGNELLTFANNAVNNAITYVIFWLYR
jgi:hypothetical protein